ncbi:hypothetical protein KP509_37G047000 [Ceratopteris richardii]|uniref:Uncharacterized protein n=1 Tax=Ceratopteris richardii TaxID=49495 RepID=A0A8T2Q7N4_CERRI|nr:hypothetical protein KP509_37G047000 [Ceratopteris richardii]
MVLGRTTAMVAAGTAARRIAASPWLVPAAVRVAGFSKHGIVSRSWAAALMRLYGADVHASSLCALLQHVGMKGLDTSTVATIEGVAAAIVLISAVFFILTGSLRAPPVMYGRPSVAMYQPLPSSSPEDQPARLKLLDRPPLLMLEAPDARVPDQSISPHEQDEAPADPMTSIATSEPDSPASSATEGYASSSESLYNPFADEPRAQPP